MDFFHLTIFGDFKSNNGINSILNPPFKNIKAMFGNGCFAPFIIQQGCPH
jgi:hypothetical protein